MRASAVETSHQRRSAHHLAAGIFWRVGEGALVSRRRKDRRWGASRSKRATLRLDVDPTRSGARSDVAEACVVLLKRVPPNTSAVIVFKETSLNGRVTESTNTPLNKRRLLRRLIHSPSCGSRDESRIRHLLFHSVAAVLVQPIVRIVVSQKQTFRRPTCPKSDMM